jgi:hypothetical protein
VGKAFAHAVEVGHVAEHHALINRLQQVRAGVQRLHAVKAAGHLQPGVAAIEERQENTSLSAFGRLATAWLISSTTCRPTAR